MLHLKFKATLKVDKEVDDLELNFKGTREETSLTIAGYELKETRSMSYVITQTQLFIYPSNFANITNIIF